MPDANEAARKIAAASLEVRRAKEEHGDGEKIRAAERRLALLLRLFIGFKDDPAFQTAYQREMAVLSKSGSGS
jgi:hypothetical protein